MITTSDDYQSICEQGRIAAAQIGNGKWTIGALATQVATQYREHNIDDFARQINIKKRRVYEYAAVWRYYNTDIVRIPHFLDERPTLSYTHMLDAVRFDHLQTSLDFLDMAALYGWTADQAEVEILRTLGKPVPAHKLYSGNARITFIEGRVVTVILPDKIQELQRGMSVEIVIRELRPGLRKVMQPDKVRRIV